ncbi:MAG: TraB/GumN family protein [Paracoccaceae bacterium]
MRLAAALAALFLAAAPMVRAECTGQNVIDAMTPQDRVALHLRAHAVPYAQGNFWKATRDGRTVHLIGTYHLDDPRHAQTMEKVEPVIAKARTVLVEAGPDEEKALMQRMARDPSVMLITNGPTLIDLLPPEEWSELAEALRQREIPPFMAAKFRPWYLTVVLSVPPCGMKGVANARGLDGMVIDAARRDKVPVKALEPYDTVFRIFDQMTDEDQLSMVRSTLATEDRSADFSKTLADSYFAQDSRLTWELMRDLSLELPGYTPEKVAGEFERMEEALMNSRNRGWIPVIEANAARGPVVAAFGALHLSGEEGVLNLLARRGWRLERLDL